MKVLVAVEDVETGKGMIATIKTCLAAEQLELKVVTVIPSIMAYTSLAMIPALVQDLRDEARKTARAMTDALTAEVKKELPTALVDSEIIEGTPAHEVIATAQEWQPDMIVVGTHSKTGLQMLALGSVSRAIVAQAPCTVLIYRPPFLEKADTEHDHDSTQRTRQEVSTRA